mgnify:CR=1 FL=1|jgi:tRNA U34 5-carboxymethylaminomethyl modifying GTPase MnmE/TrmE
MRDRIDKILRKSQQQFDQLQRNLNMVYIVNAGRMNHGKSSLFNAILDKNAFAVADIRTTIACKEEIFSPGVIFIDTPGLDALKKDDEIAFEAYKKANLIVFVHTLRIGEFHSDELQQLNNIISVFPQKDKFWEHFCLVLTFKESLNDDELKDIEYKILKDIKDNCGAGKFRVFHVSNSRYTKGRSENKKALVMHSGIPELKQYIQDYIGNTQKNSYQLSVQRWNKSRNSACQKLLQMKGEIQNCINQKKSKYQEQMYRIQKILDFMNDDIGEDMVRIDGLSMQIKSTERAKKILEEQWHSSK